MDGCRHVIVDTNLLIYYLHPDSADTVTVRDRCQTLFKSALAAQWSGVRLYAPAISIAEAIGVLDKYRFCTWAGPVKQDPTKRLSTNSYREARESLAKAIRQRVIEQIDHEPAHVSLASLISPINQMFQYRRHRKPSSRVKKPMGGADCLIAGIAVLLHRRLGPGQVLLATADQRLADVLTKCRQLTAKRAESLGIRETAEAVGIPWSSEVFPPCVNLRDGKIDDLRSAFFGWPLPTMPCHRKSKDQLTPADEAAIVQEWLAVAKRYGMRNPDQLPHTTAIDELRTHVAAKIAVEMTNRELFLALLGIRKAGRLPRVRMP